MAAFEQTGQPTGYDQIQPNLDLPKQPQQQQQGGGAPQPSPLTTAITQPSQYPGDPSMMAWRQGGVRRQQQPQQSPQQPPPQQSPSMATGGLAPAGGAQTFGPGQRNPITGGILGPNQGGSISAPVAFNGTAGSNTPNGRLGAPAQQSSHQNLSDPSTWMGMVGNQPALTDWVRGGLGAQGSNDELVNYYVGKIKGQPGANTTEQQGAADYWMKKLQNDPKVTGRPAAPQGGTISPMQRAMLFGHPQQQQTNPYQSLIMQLLQQSTGAQPMPTTIG